jgi:PEP-CTERM motif
MSLSVVGFHTMRRLSFQTILRLCLFTAAAGLLATSPLRASVVTVYSNFSENPGTGAGSYPYACPDASCNIYAYSVDWFGQANFPVGVRSYSIAEAMPFTVSGSQDLYLYEVSMAMYKYPDNTRINSTNTLGVNHDNLTIEIVSDAGGLPSSNVLEVLSVDPSIAEDDTTFLDLYSSTHPLLQAGQVYWIVARPTSIDTTTSNLDTWYGWIENQEGAQWKYTSNQWNYSLNNGNGAYQGFFSQPQSYTAPTLNVLATTDLAGVPEPATFGVAGLALAGLAVLRKRK